MGSCIHQQSYYPHSVARPPPPPISSHGGLTTQDGWRRTDCSQNPGEQDILPKSQNPIRRTQGRRTPIKNSELISCCVFREERVVRSCYAPCSGCYAPPCKACSQSTTRLIRECALAIHDARNPRRRECAVLMNRYYQILSFPSRRPWR